jgi:KaiC/GvpD/RAD55 family RecA-like ATPase
LLLATIGSSASSRQAVADRPGIGKTTLVQTVKADAQAEGDWSSDAVIPISTEGASEQLLGQLLSGVYDASEPRRSCQAGTQANSNVLQQRPT